MWRYQALRLHYYVFIFIVPAYAENGQTIHLIFEVKDSGILNFTRYQCVIITVI
jgi:hypothetical protein